MTDEALEAFETLEYIYKSHIEETLDEELPDDHETIAMAHQCRAIIRTALAKLTPKDGRCQCCGQLMPDQPAQIMDVTKGRDDG